MDFFDAMTQALLGIKPDLSGWTSEGTTFNRRFARSLAHILTSTLRREIGQYNVQCSRVCPDLGIITTFAILRSGASLHYTCASQNMSRSGAPRRNHIDLQDSAGKPLGPRVCQSVTAQVPPPVPLL